MIKKVSVSLSLPLSKLLKQGKWGEIHSFFMGSAHPLSLSFPIMLDRESEPKERIASQTLNATGIGSGSGSYLSWRSCDRLVRENDECLQAQPSHKP